jgi:hypothetical protein
MAMEQIPCFYCGSFFDPSPRHKNQTACKKEKCQKAKKAAWKRHRMKTDPIYAANQKSSQQQWVNANPGYWKNYREKNPEKAERNRIAQAMRNRNARAASEVTGTKKSPPMTAAGNAGSASKPLLTKSRSKNSSENSGWIKTSALFHLWDQKRWRILRPWPGQGNRSKKMSQNCFV